MSIIGRGLHVSPDNGIIQPICTNVLPTTVIDGEIVIITTYMVPKVIFGTTLPSTTVGYDNYTVFVYLVDEGEHQSANIMASNGNIAFDLKFGMSKILIDGVWNDVDGYIGINGQWVKFGYGGIDSNTLLLMHFNDSTTSDSSMYNRVGTVTGTPTISSDIKRFGAGSCNFPTSSWVDFTDPTPFYFGALDFTIDWWEYRQSVNNASAIISGSGNSWILAYPTGNILHFYASSNNSSWDIGSSFEMGTVIINQWIHRAVVRHNGIFNFYQNGVRVSSLTTSVAALFSPADYIRIGAYTSNSCNCYIDEIRISNVARWTQNFIPPNAEYTK